MFVVPRTRGQVGRANPGPWRPVRELEGALQLGDLAITAAHDLQQDGHRISLSSGLELLALIALKKPENFDRWALRWLGR